MVSLTFLELCSSTNYLFHSAEIKLGLQRGGWVPVTAAIFLMVAKTENACVRISVAAAGPQVV